MHNGRDRTKVAPAKIAKSAYLRKLDPLKHPVAVIPLQCSGESDVSGVNCSMLAFASILTLGPTLSMHLHWGDCVTSVYR